MCDLVCHFDPLQLLQGLDTCGLFDALSLLHTVCHAVCDVTFPLCASASVTVTCSQADGGFAKQMQSVIGKYAHTITKSNTDACHLLLAQARCNGLVTREQFVINCENSPPRRSVIWSPWSLVEPTPVLSHLCLIANGAH